MTDTAIRPHQSREHLDRIRALIPRCLGHQTLLAQTCRACGELRSGDEFPQRHAHGRRYRIGNCRDCHYASRARARRLQAYQRWEKAS